MNVKTLRPNLVDPLLGKKIVKTLKVQQAGYWEPTKNVCHNIYHKYIKPNKIIVVVVIIVAILLLYRYRTTKRNKVTAPVTPNQPSNEINDLVFNLYKQQVEASREPRSDTKPQFAYPIYPYDNGTLEPSGKNE